MSLRDSNNMLVYELSFNLTYDICWQAGKIFRNSKVFRWVNHVRLINAFSILGIKIYNVQSFSMMKKMLFWWKVHLFGHEKTVIKKDYKVGQPISESLMVRERTIKSTALENRAQIFQPWLRLGVLNNINNKDITNTDSLWLEHTSFSASMSSCDIEVNN